jgi:DNA-directed RNA polymerase subunit A"
MLKRKLTEFEIEDILDFIKPQPNIPPETAISIINLTKNKIRNQLKNQELYPEIIPELKKELIKNYYDCQISPGESVGILCAQSIGEKNTQNSVIYEEEIILKHKGNIFKTYIGEFIDSLMNEENNINGNYVKSLEEYEILTISQDEKIEWKEINEISKHPTNGDLIKIKTESGREVTTTLAHSHLKRENNKILPILGSELQIGYRIPVIKKADISSIESNNDPNSIIFSWFLGIYLSFGSIFHNCVVIKNTNKKIDDFFRLNIMLMLSNYHGNEKVDDDMIKVEQKCFYFIYSTKLVEIVKELFGIDGYCKNIPDFIYNMSKNEMRGFLRGFFEESSTISKSEKHLLCVQMILCNFGIYSRIKYEKITDECFYYKLLIQNKYKHKFYEILPTIKLDESIFEEDYETIHPDVIDKENYESDVIWEKIVELKIIKEEEYKHKHVYDFSVNDNETFGLLNGIVVHNTLNTLIKGQVISKI